MKERGMIFNGEMVRAILDGRKTQTRREIKLNLDIACLATTYDWATSLAANHYQGLTEEQIQQKAESLRGVIHPVILANGQMVSIICPHGKPGDRIWVRETWAEAGASAPDLKLYRANYPEHVPSIYENVPPAEEIRWTPSIHMPRTASRILLEITDVRVERLNAISEEDAIAEGMQGVICPCCKGDSEYSTSQYDAETLAVVDEIPCRACESNRRKFFTLWDSIYGYGQHCIGEWVWVIEFKRVEGGAA
ncbi:morphogenetic protein [Klebsiella pneumoniae]|uniref:hypothetical protein n=1 Tax=Klebsiella pneumoniae TaxID=573 RepID=UPI0010CF363A|nr:hypothetical protein [Klebsiella pneumoniae]VTM84892.1 morphogenetic protein [Klebsiella pneumoniae]